MLDDRTGRVHAFEEARDSRGDSVGRERIAPCGRGWWTTFGRGRFDIAFARNALRELHRAAWDQGPASKAWREDGAKPGWTVKVGYVTPATLRGPLVRHADPCDRPRSLRGMRTAMVAQPAMKTAMVAVPIADTVQVCRLVEFAGDVMRLADERQDNDLRVLVDDLGGKQAGVTFTLGPGAKY